MRIILKKILFFTILLIFFQLFISAEQKKEFLVIKTKIKNCKVYINDTFAGKAGEGGFVIPLNPGTHLIKIKSFFYKTFEKEIIINDLSRKLLYQPEKKIIFNFTFILILIFILIVIFKWRQYYLKKSPKYFGKYKLKQEIGKGGVATIYKAYDRKMKKELALKIMNKNYIEDNVLVEKFLREGKVLSIIKKKYPDSHVVKVYEYGRMLKKGNIPFIAMDYLKGKTLLNIIKENKKISDREALQYISDIACALKDCHNSGIYHRDLSPDNVFILDKTSKIVLIDFGIAKNEFTSYRTLDGSVSGKPIYMAPEQCRGETISSATDIYTLGILLFLLIEGNPPFTGSNPLDIMNKHQNAKVPKMTQILDGKVELLINRMMQKKSNLRPGIDEVILITKELISRKQFNKGKVGST